MFFISQSLIKQHSPELGRVLPLIQHLYLSQYIPCFPADRKPIRHFYIAIHPRLLQCRIFHFPKNYRLTPLFTGNIFRTSLSKVTGKVFGFLPKELLKTIFVHNLGQRCPEWKDRTKLWISVARKFLWNSAMFHAMVFMMVVFWVFILVWFCAGGREEFMFLGLFEFGGLGFF